ncbi:hypothetical protein D3C76_753510 [compost metagenome]
MEILLYQTIRRFEPNLTITVGFSTHLFGGHLIVVRRHSFSCQMLAGVACIKRGTDGSAAGVAGPGTLIGYWRKGIRAPAG